MARRRCRPTYDPGADYDDARGGPQVVSYNIGSVNTVPWCESVTVPTWLSISHEPENGKFPNGQAFVDHYTAEVDVIRSVGNPLISVGPISMAYAYRSTYGNGLDGSYLPPVDYCDWYGVDVYQQLPNVNLPDFDYWKNWYALVAGRGKPILIGEMGIYAEPNQYSGGTIDPALQAKRALLIPQYFDYLRSLGNVICALWWCTPGKPGEPGNYMPSDQPSLNALRAVPPGRGRLTRRGRSRRRLSLRLLGAGFGRAATKPVRSHEHRRRRWVMLSRLGFPPIGAHRRFVTALLVDAVGSGVFMPISILYFLSATSLSLVHIGLALSIGAATQLPSRRCSARSSTGSAPSAYCSERTWSRRWGSPATCSPARSSASSSRRCSSTWVSTAFWGSFSPVVASDLEPRRTRTLVRLPRCVAQCELRRRRAAGSRRDHRRHPRRTRWSSSANLPRTCSPSSSCCRWTSRPPEAIAADGSRTRRLGEGAARRSLPAVRAHKCHVGALGTGAQRGDPGLLTKILDLPGWVAGIVFTINTVLIGVGQGLVVNAMAGFVRARIVAFGSLLYGCLVRRVPRRGPASERSLASRS